MWIIIKNDKNEVVARVEAVPGLTLPVPAGGTVEIEAKPPASDAPKLSSAVAASKASATVPPKSVPVGSMPAKGQPAKTATTSPPISSKSTASRWPFDLPDGREYTWSEPENLGPKTNSEKQDSAPTVSADGLCLVFHAHRSGGGDLFECRRKSLDEPWGSPAALTTLNNSSYQNYPWLSADGLTLLFCGSKSPGPTKAQGGGDLYQTRRSTRDAPWGSPVNLGPNVNSASNDNHGRLSADGLTLYFDSDRREQSQGGFDIWQSRRKTLDAPWEKAVNLGPTINTKAADGCPQPLADGKSLLFTRGYTSEMRLYLAERASGSGYAVRPIDSPVDEPSFWLLADGQTLLFASERPGGLGNWDLWMTRRVAKVGKAPGTAAAANSSLFNVENTWTPADGKLDVLPLIDVKADWLGGGGQCKRDQGVLTTICAQGKYGRIALPVRMAGDCRLTVAFSCVGSPNQMTVRFPLGPTSSVTVATDRGQQAIPPVTGTTGSSPWRRAGHYLQADESQVFSYVVKNLGQQCAVQTTINGGAVLDVTAPIDRTKQENESHMQAALADGRIALEFGYIATCKITKIELEMLSGHATLLRSGLHLRR
ncbi:MAG TPA: hypothetical protein VHV55_03125 [Pirellulales bacterium]|nr:hypothetical protein [Pirellulales bacterium]